MIQFRVGWIFKAGINNPPDPINVTSLKDRLREYIRIKNGYFDKYQVEPEKIYSKSE